MPTVAQPGRIAPKESPGKIPGSGGSASGAAGTAEQAVKDPAGAAMSQVTAKFSADDIKNRFKKALSQAHRNERTPSLVQYRMSLFEWGILIAISATIDVLENISGWFILLLGIGEIFVAVFDIIYGVMLACYCKFRFKLPIMAHLPIYISILGAELLEYIPFVNAFWWADAWYIGNVMRSEDRATHKQLMEKIESEKQEQSQKDRMEEYARQQAEQPPEEIDTEQSEDRQTEGRINPGMGNYNFKAYQTAQGSNKTTKNNGVGEGRIAA